MEEITRFLQIRSVQKMADENKSALGLPIFPNVELTEFADKLKKAGCNKQEYSERIERYKIDPNSTYIRDLPSINPIILKISQWIDYKSKPIGGQDFKDFFESFFENHKSEILKMDFEKELEILGDNFLVSIHDHLVAINYHIDFTLLIKSLYVIKKSIDKQNHVNILKGNEWLNKIVNAPLLVPEGLLNYNCSAEKLVKIPKVPERLTEENVKCECKCNETCESPSSHWTVLHPYVADLLIVKEELLRYEESDVASIENILAGESLKRIHRNVLKTEDINEEENESISIEEKDHQVSEKFALQNEVSKTIQASLSGDAGITATMKYGPTTTITAHANIAGNFSKSQSNSSARSYAKDLIDRSVSKMEEKVRRLQISKIVQEIKDKNTHSIDNTKGEHRAGIFYWVNKITKAQIYNLEKHLMFDIVIPEPASIYKKLITEKNKITKKKFEPPVKPNLTPASIKRATYGNLLNEYGLAGSEPPPNELIWLEFSFHKNLSESDASKPTGFSEIFQSPQISDGYKAVSLTFDIRVSTGHPKGTGPKDEVAVTANICNKCIFSESMNEHLNNNQSNKNWSKSDTIALNGEEGILTMAISGFSSLPLSISGGATIKCELSPEGYDRWKHKIYNLIMDNYMVQLQTYNASLSQDQEILHQIKGNNPFLNRETEKNELKRNIIAILLNNYFNGIGSILERTAPCGYPEIDFRKLEQDAPVIQFFEQVFEWNYLTYLFYHSMWARKCKWPDLINEDSGDPLFDKFLMAGACRVQVPVRLGMEEIFLWYLKTRQIWGASGIPPISGDIEYVSMIQEIIESRQGDYSIREGFIKATQGNEIIRLTESKYYWDVFNNVLNALNLENDIDREILINYKIYRIVKVEQVNVADTDIWDITLDRAYLDPTANSLKHAVGALYVGAPWEVKIPTKLVYLRNSQDKLPHYPLL
ncbi:hypothetical protein H4O18_16405 [Arenibacter sp. BSSL-BM3]|uniref:Uncharacterized protein n=1 Tax=Arenibacter arenosicollis TaxID=2762274 RepID=A0ABR7QQW6_9FLAO|nr:hypothetical protein [Arenibacter arenosicollis]MBC8769582.1 hypothetical protein [Arenibacter arenosicollis]